MFVAGLVSSFYGLCALGFGLIYNSKGGGISEKYLRKVFKEGFYGCRAGPSLLSLMSA